MSIFWFSSCGYTHTPFQILLRWVLDGCLVNSGISFLTWHAQSDTSVSPKLLAVILVEFLLCYTHSVTISGLPLFLYENPPRPNQVASTQKLDSWTPIHKSPLVLATIVSHIFKIIIFNFSISFLDLFIYYFRWINCFVINSLRIQIMYIIVSLLHQQQYTNEK